MTIKAAPSRRDVLAPPEQRPDLQGMRAVAVLTVFADHLFGWPSGGFVGVDIFFVLSGFFITGLLIRERTRSRTVSFSDFYVRRVKRILPSALLVLVVTVIAAYQLFPGSRAKETLVDALWAAVFGANFRFEAVGADYFQQDQPPSPLQHYWSLSIEEQFYFVWPWLLVGIFYLTRRYRKRRKTWVHQWGLFASMAVIVTASFTWAMFASATDPNAAYFSTFTRVWELGVGALTAIAAPWLVRIPESLRPTLAYTGLTGVIASLFLITPTVQFPAPWAALPVLSTALVIAAFNGSSVRGVPFLTNPVIRWFGDTSYTLYLWHWPVIIVLESAISRDATFYFVALGLSLGLTAATYHLYENPIRHSAWMTVQTSRRRRDGHRKRPVKRSVWAFIGFLMAAACVMSILAIRYDARLAQVAEDAAPLADELTLLPAEVDPCFGAPAMRNSNCALYNRDRPLAPGIDDFANDLKRQTTCYRKKDESLKSCSYGYKEADATRIALVGDSHAAALLPGLWPVLKQNKWQLTTYVGHGCAWRTPPIGECPIDEIEADLIAERYDLVLTTSLATDYHKPEAFARAWEPATAVGSRIAVIADNPLLAEDTLNCLTMRGKDPGECAVSRELALGRADPLVGAAALVPATKVIDLSPYYCVGDRCPLVIGNVIVYRDFHHLTGTFAQTLSPALEEGIRLALAI